MSLGGLESVSPQWGFEQLTPITGRLTLDGAYIPMEMRTIFPVHPELNQLSQVMQIDFDELLAGYMGLFAFEGVGVFGGVRRVVAG